MLWQFICCVSNESLTTALACRRQISSELSELHLHSVVVLFFRVWLYDVQQILDAKRHAVLVPDNRMKCVDDVIVMPFLWFMLVIVVVSCRCDCYTRGQCNWMWGDMLGSWRIQVPFVASQCIYDLAQASSQQQQNLVLCVELLAFFLISHGSGVTPEDARGKY